MDNDRMQHREPDDDELARRLEAYAAARLSPEPSATTRMRAHVMVAAYRHAALSPVDTDRAAAVAADFARRGPRRGPTWRRPASLLLAAGLTLGLGVGSVAAAQPGGPLYGVRVWTETLSLPSEANERAQAELRRLQDRLSEAAAASAAGDTNAANASLEAYGAIVREATTGATVSAAATATLDVGIRRNIAVLTVLADRVPEQARGAIENAIHGSDSALDAINEHGQGQPGGPPATTPANSSKPDATDRPGRTPNANQPAPKPAEATQKPHPTPKPDHTPPAGGPPTDPPGGGNSSQTN